MVAKELFSSEGTVTVQATHPQDWAKALGSQLLEAVERKDAWSTLHPQAPPLPC